MLCPGCHHTLHRLAEMLLHGNGVKAQDYANMLYTKRGARIILELANRVAVEFQKMREGDATLPETVRITIELPRAVVGKLKLLAFEWNHSKAGLRPFLQRQLTLLALTAGRLHPNTDNSSTSADGAPAQQTIRVKDFF